MIHNHWIGFAVTETAIEKARMACLGKIDKDVSVGDVRVKNSLRLRITEASGKESR
jgi:hypothetical protein